MRRRRLEVDDTGRVRIGLIGAGSVARSHLDGYLRAPDVVTVARIADVDRGNAERLAARVPDARVDDDYRELMASRDVDAVDICLPHHLHADAIVAAAE